MQSLTSCQRRMAYPVVMSPRVNQWTCSAVALTHLFCTSDSETACDGGHWRDGEGDRASGPTVHLWCRVN